MIIDKITYWDFIKRDLASSITVFEKDLATRHQLSELDSLLFHCVSVNQNFKVYIVQYDIGIKPVLFSFDEIVCISLNNNLSFINITLQKEVDNILCESPCVEMNLYFDDVFVICETSLIVLNKSLFSLLNIYFTDQYCKVLSYKSDAGLYILLADNKILNIQKIDSKYHVSTQQQK